MGSTPLGPKSRVWQVHARDHDLQGEGSALEHPRLVRPSHLHMLTHTCLAHAYRQFITSHVHVTWQLGRDFMGSLWHRLHIFFLPSATGASRVDALANVTQSLYVWMLSRPQIFTCYVSQRHYKCCAGRRFCNSRCSPFFEHVRCPLTPHVMSDLCGVHVAFFLFVWVLIVLMRSRFCFFEYGCKPGIYTHERGTETTHVHIRAHKSPAHSLARHPATRTPVAPPHPATRPSVENHRDREE